MAFGNSTIPWYIFHIEEVERRLRDNGAELTEEGRRMLVDALRGNLTPDKVVRLFVYSVLSQPIRD